MNKYIEAQGGCVSDRGCITVRNPPRGILAGVSVTPCCLRPMESYRQCNRMSLFALNSPGICLDWDFIPSDLGFFPVLFHFLKQTSCDSKISKVNDMCLGFFLSLHSLALDWFSFSSQIRPTPSLETFLPSWSSDNFFFFMVEFYNKVEICSTRDPSVRVLLLGIKKWIVNENFQNHVSTSLFSEGLKRKIGLTFTECPNAASSMPRLLHEQISLFANEKTEIQKV